MKVELLYVRGCPHHGETRVLLRQVLDGANIAAAIEEIEVRGNDEAEALGFLGSPSIRIDGRDIEAGAGERRDFGMSCRVYASEAGYSGVPPQEMIRDAMRANTGAKTPGTRVEL